MSTDQILTLMILRLTKLKADFPELTGSECEEVLSLEIDCLKQIKESLISK